MKEYVLATKAYPWLLPIVEDSLRGVDDGAVKEASRLARGLRMPTGRPISEDEALIAFNALCDLGVLERVGSRYRFNKAQLDATEHLRSGIRAALAIVQEDSLGNASDAQLCVSLPPSFSPAAESIIRESSTDLRSSLLDVVAVAKRSLIVASPFWDAETTAEMISLTRKKLSSGVRVWLLGRFSRDLPADVRAELRKVADEKECSILSWFEGTGADTQTFHFKAVSADRGLRGYIGSANMTVSSLRSRMELGVVLMGTAAAQLDRILRVVISMASRIQA